MPALFAAAGFCLFWALAWWVAAWWPAGWPWPVSTASCLALVWAVCAAAFIVAAAAWAVAPR